MYEEVPLLTIPVIFLIVLSLSGVGMIIGGIPSGWIMDRAPGHRVLAASHLIQVVSEGTRKWFSYTRACVLGDS